MKTVHDVAAYQLCCGCGVCAYLHSEQIKMVDVPDSGRRPVSILSDNDRFTSDFELQSFCPGIALTSRHNNNALSELINFASDAWGGVLEVFEGHAADSEIRYKGSSGGAISALALYCLEQEKMQGVLHTKADEHAPYLNITSMSHNRDDILVATGSRYSPASPCEQLIRIENAQGSSVFIGKPCDVAAVEKARTLKPELDKKIGLTIACFCAGTPSTKGTLEMLGQLGVIDKNRLKKLRYRGCGWPGMTTASHQQHDEVETVDSEMSYQQSWGKILQKFRPWRCYICPDHTGEFADIAVGDPWYKEIESDSAGRSLILVRSRKGREILHQAIDAGYLLAEKVSPEIVPASQPNLLKARAALWGRLVTLKNMGAPCPKYLNTPLFSLWVKELSTKEKAQSIYGTVKRVYTKQLKKKQNLFKNS
ncbi:MAG: coenzyme F420 hydrogenase [Candidatus Electrothrix sp. AW2]|nr:coenzyme F420 hydrogenase [Candidatus Electrothrix gigas]